MAANSASAASVGTLKVSSFQMLACPAALAKNGGIDTVKMAFVEFEKCVRLDVVECRLL